MVTTAPETIVIPSSGETLSLALSPRLQAVREKALARQRLPQPPIPEILLADGRSWAQHTPEEDWLLWRARRCAERLRSLPLELWPGERVPGTPCYRQPDPAEQAALAAAQRTLADMPPFPGGDSGHFHPDWETVLALGIGGLRERVAEYAAREGLTAEQQVFYQACDVVLSALGDFVARAGDECEAMASQDPEGAEDWQALAALCRQVATAAPQTFREAVQLLYLTTIALWFAEDHPLCSPGRLDQTLRRFYQADREAGRLTTAEALELLSSLFINYNRLLWPGSAVAVMVGGRDKTGANVTNELTYLALAARLATRLVYPTVGLVWHEGTPGELMDFAVEMLATGCGDPAVFNDEVISAGLREHDVAEGDSHNYVNSTCVEIKVAGASNMWVTAPYYNCAQALLDVLGEVAASDEPEPTFEQLQALTRQKLADRIATAAGHLDETWRLRSERGCFPLASCVISDCLERGQDFDRGGARYNWVENSFVGLANLVDSLTAVRYLVYEEGELTLRQLQEILKADFADQEALRQRILRRLPKYGNAVAEADELAAQWAETLMDETEKHTVGLHRYVPGFFCWVMHERMGSETGATPDGRQAGWPLADGAGAAQGRELCGPTASVLSTTCWPHRRVLGGLVHNAKFPQSLLSRPEGKQALRQVIETYMQRGGFEIQINVVGRETLLEARAHPEQFPDLLVRVAGYSDYFVHLSDKMQQEVIARTEHCL